MAQQQKKSGDKKRRPDHARVSQRARTLRNKHNAAARRARRKEYWRSPEGVDRKERKHYARVIKKSRKAMAPTVDHSITETMPSGVQAAIIHSLKLDAGTVTGHRNDDLRLRGYPSEAGYNGWWFGFDCVKATPENTMR